MKFDITCYEFIEGVNYALEDTYLKLVVLNDSLKFELFDKKTDERIYVKTIITIDEKINSSHDVVNLLIDIGQIDRYNYE